MFAPHRQHILFRYLIVAMLFLSLGVFFVSRFVLGAQGPTQPPPIGSGALSIGQNGNVGIGTAASPTYKLDVGGDIRGTRVFGSVYSP